MTPATAIDAVTEAILDHEHQLQAMDDDGRESYRPRAHQRAEFLVGWLYANGWTVHRDQPTIDITLHLDTDAIRAAGVAYGVAEGYAAGRARR